MTFSEIRKKVGTTTIQTKSVLSGTRTGAFKVYAAGSGYDFDQLREYQEGDDFRRIDWKSSARSNTLLMREYKDERSRTTHIVLDSSASMAYGSQKLLLSDVARELAMALCSITTRTDDDITLHGITHAAQALHGGWGSGEKHLMQLLHTLNAVQYEGKRPLKNVLEQFHQRCRRRSLVFLISDFIDADYDTVLRTLALRHELAVIRIRDVNEDAVVAATAAITCQDSELASVAYEADGVDGGAVMRRWRNEQALQFKKLQIPWFDCYNDGHHLDQLLEFIRRYF